jgi:hypothetical protein
MMNSIRHSSKLVMLVFVMLILASGCKSKKKAMEAAAAEKARMEQEEARRLQEEEMKRKEAEEQAKRDAAATQGQASAPREKLALYFDAISNASNATSANNTISEALTLFASPETPVLIVISESGGQKDYDRPTTIQNYLNYLKDQKKNMNKISNVQFDSSGKITELELRKQ